MSCPVAAKFPGVAAWAAGAVARAMPPPAEMTAISAVNSRRILNVNLSPPRGSPIALLRDEKTLP
jgi:hypothetical protein